MAQAQSGSAVAQDEEVSRAQLPIEFMLNTLRLREGIELTRFVERTGLPLSAIKQAFKNARGLLADDPGWFRRTDRGFDFLNDMQELFLPMKA